MTLYHRVADIPTTESLLREACTLLHNVNATFVPSNDSANAMCVSLCQRITALIAELRAAAQQSALDELVRENERLGLYDDQRPVAWRCRDYVTGCWFISVKPDPAGSIAGESVPLYAAPAPAQPRQPLSVDDVRSQFEAWVRTRPGHPFAGKFLNLMWDAWKAARAITGDKP